METKINGAKLREIRLHRGVSIRQLADAANVNKSTITRIEKGEVSPTIEVVERILTALNMSIRIHEDEKEM